MGVSWSAISVIASLLRITLVRYHMHNKLKCRGKFTINNDSPFLKIEKIVDVPFSLEMILGQWGLPGFLKTLNVPCLVPRTYSL